jgi:hypothetical protein
MAKSFLKYPYINKSEEAIIPILQNRVGATTFFSFSEESHWTNNLIEKRICAIKPIEYIE